MLGATWETTWNLEPFEQCETNKLLLCVGRVRIINNFSEMLQKCYMILINATVNNKLDCVLNELLMSNIAQYILKLNIKCLCRDKPDQLILLQLAG